jgi:hypothetical protein
MQVTLADVVSIPESVMSRKVGDDTVLLDLASSNYFGLSGPSARIWEWIGAGNPLAEIVSLLVAEYEVDRSTAEADLVELATDLVGRGLLKRT